MAIAVTTVLGGVALIVFASGARLGGRTITPLADETPVGLASSAAASPIVTYPPLLLRATNVVVRTDGFWSWALMDMRSGKIDGSANRADRNTTASMIKPWLASDYLRRTHESGSKPDQARLQLLSKMIRVSDNDAAWTMWYELGQAATIQRLVQVCQLTDTRAGSRWSLTEVSARDTVRMGACIANGTAAGPQWTSWLLNEMRLVQGEGDFGIRAALPATVAKQTAIKNGWIARPEDHNWHLNCLAIGDGWVLSVLQRYPEKLGMTHGKDVCKSVTQQLLTSGT